MSRRLKSSYIAILLLACLGIAIGLVLRHSKPQPLVLPKNSEPATTSSSAESSKSLPNFPQPQASISDTELLQLARTVVARSPQEAIVWAQSQSNSELKQRQIHAVLQAWGEIDPRAAAMWASMQDDSEKAGDLEAVFLGSARQPKLAMEILRDLIASDPDTAGECGTALIRGLIAGKNFQASIELLNLAPEEYRNDWANVLFHGWSQSKPVDAFQSVAGISDPELHQTALKAVADSWSANDPGALAKYAVSMSAGADRDYALKQSMDNWSLQDPTAMAEWLNQLPPGNDFDQGAALMLSKADAANRPLDIALRWIDAIEDPTLKFQSLSHVLPEWKQSDPDAAAHYVQTAPWLSDAQRAELQRPPSQPLNED